MLHVEYFESGMHDFSVYLLCFFVLSSPHTLKVYFTAALGKASTRNA